MKRFFSFMASHYFSFMKHFISFINDLILFHELFVKEKKHCDEYLVSRANVISCPLEPLNTEHLALWSCTKQIFTECADKIVGLKHYYSARCHRWHVYQVVWYCNSLRLYIRYAIVRCVAGKTPARRVLCFDSPFILDLRSKGVIFGS